MQRNLLLYDLAFVISIELHLLKTFFCKKRRKKKLVYFKKHCKPAFKWAFLHVSLQPPVKIFRNLPCAVLSRSPYGCLISIRMHLLNGCVGGASTKLKGSTSNKSRSPPLYPPSKREGEKCSMCRFLSQRQFSATPNIFEKNICREILSIGNN